MKKLISCLLLVAILFSSGCALVSGYRDAAILKAGYQRKAVAESVIEQVKHEYADKLTANQRQIELAQETFTKGLTGEIQAAANSLYAAHLAAILNAHPDRTHLVVDNKVVEAQTALKVPPTIEAMAAANIEIKRLLDETLTSLDQLKAEHEKDLGEAKQVADRATKAETDLAAAKQAKLDIEAAKATALAAKQADLDKANNEVIAGEHARGDDAKARQAMLTKMSMGAGLLAALCLAGAIWSPVFKTQFGLAAAVLGVAAVGIWYLTPVVVLCIVGGGVLAVAGWAAFSHNKEHAAATDTYRAIQRVKENAPEAYAAAVKPELDEAATKYVTKDGVVTKVPDPARVAFIDARLVAVGDK